MKSKSHVGCFATEGRRSTMEDEWFIREKAATNSHSTLAGIFDGHSGVSAAQFVRDTLPDIIIKRMGGEGEKDPSELMKEAFLACERAFLDQALTKNDRSGIRHSFFFFFPSFLLYFPSSFYLFYYFYCFIACVYFILIMEL